MYFSISPFFSPVRRNNCQFQWEVSLSLVVSLSPVPGLTSELSREENANFAKTMANRKINSAAMFCAIQTLANWSVLSSDRTFAKCVELQAKLYTQFSIKIWMNLASFCFWSRFIRQYESMHSTFFFIFSWPKWVQNLSFCTLQGPHFKVGKRMWWH